MKLLKRKLPPQPSNRFQQYLQSQPVFNWFDRYSEKDKPSSHSLQENRGYSTWIAKRANEL